MSDKSITALAPDLPVQNNPLFSWPLDIRAVLGWYRHAWDIPSELLIFSAWPGLTALWLQPVLAPDGASAFLFCYGCICAM